MWMKKNQLLSSAKTRRVSSKKSEKISQAAILYSCRGPHMFL
jgi:hypothetical protein